jgi:hypothetical protein
MASLGPTNYVSFWDRRASNQYSKEAAAASAAANAQYEQEVARIQAMFQPINTAPPGGQPPSTSPYSSGPSKGLRSDASIKDLYSQIEAATRQQTDRYVAEQQAVQARREDLAAQYGQREQELTRYLTGLGTSQKDELERQRQSALSRQQQEMINRGMLSTSSYQAGARGVDTAYNQQQAALNEQLQKMQMDYRTALSGETLAAKQSATESAGKMWGDILAANLKPLESRQDLGKFFQESSLAETQQQAAKMKADLEYRAQQSAILAQRDAAAQEAKLKLQELALQRMGLQQENALGYAKLSNDLSIARETSKGTAKDRAMAAVIRQGLQSARDYAQNRWMDIDENAYLARQMQSFMGG